MINVSFDLLKRNHLCDAINQRQTIPTKAFTTRKLIFLTPTKNCRCLFRLSISCQSFRFLERKENGNGHETQSIESIWELHTAHRIQNKASKPNSN